MEIDIELLLANYERIIRDLVVRLAHAERQLQAASDKGDVKIVPEQEGRT